MEDTGPFSGRPVSCAKRAIVSMFSAADRFFFSVGGGPSDTGSVSSASASFSRGGDAQSAHQSR